MVTPEGCGHPGNPNARIDNRTHASASNRGAALIFYAGRATAFASRAAGIARIPGAERAATLAARAAGIVAGAVPASATR